MLQKKLKLFGVKSFSLSRIVMMIQRVPDNSFSLKCVAWWTSPKDRQPSFSRQVRGLYVGVPTPCTGYSGWFRLIDFAVMQLGWIPFGALNLVCSLCQYWNHRLPYIPSLNRRATCIEVILVFPISHKIR